MLDVTDTTPGETGRDPVSSAVDVALVELVADLTRRNADLAAAAAVWQERAAHLEGRLLQLTDGSRADDATDGPERVGEDATTGDGTYRQHLSGHPGASAGMADG